MIILAAAAKEEEEKFRALFKAARGNNDTFVVFNCQSYFLFTFQLLLLLLQLQFEFWNLSRLNFCLATNYLFLSFSSKILDEKSDFSFVLLMEEAKYLLQRIGAIVSQFAAHFQPKFILIQFNWRQLFKFKLLYITLQTSLLVHFVGNYDNKNNNNNDWIWYSVFVIFIRLNWMKSITRIAHFSMCFNRVALYDYGWWK